jgi:hypothetical protein
MKNLEEEKINKETTAAQADEKSKQGWTKSHCFY